MKTLTPSQKAQLTRKRNAGKSAVARYAASAILGGIIPALIYHVSHFQAPDLTKTPWGPEAALWLLVAGGLAYSAPMVATWFSRYAGVAKAWGFVILLEGCMTFTAPATSLPALVALIALNAIVLAGRMRND